jgi:hypothetical protein
MVKYLTAREKGETFTALENYASVDTPWVGLCGQGHECAPRLASVQRGGGICDACAGIKKLTHDQAVARMAECLTVREKGEIFIAVGNYVDAHSAWKGLCGQGHECAPRLNNVQRGGGFVTSARATES